MEKRKLEGQIAISYRSQQWHRRRLCKRIGESRCNCCVNYPVPGAKEMAEAVVE